MLLVMPSDPATHKASAYLSAQGVAHSVIEIPAELDYQAGATVGIYLDGAEHDQLMRDLSAQGIVIMRVFKSFALC